MPAMRNGAGSIPYFWVQVAGWLSALVALAVLALGAGRFPISLGELADVLGRELLGWDIEVDERVETIVLQVRLPRVAAAVAIGCALSAAGAVYQTLFRNPLVSPDILGVSAGAGLGAVLGIFLSLPVIAIQGLAFGFGVGTVLLVYMIAAAVRAHEPVLVLVLVGLVLGTLAGSLIALLKVLADPYDQLPAITFWLLGSLAAIAPPDILTSMPLVLGALLPLLLLRWRINVMALGDEEARTLGVDVGKLRAVCIAAATLMTAAAVSISGVIGWIGLLVPHIARMLVGPNFPALLPMSALLGGAFLLAVDTLARTAMATEIPLGIITSVLGAPVFLMLLARSRWGWR
jgi:iron complex transport system permease protein